ncbi:MAG: MarC family protein [Puniceicoccales bacterium]|jgi:multiple antibiotic resistance protein|nr:MarC family protein [Puniceicoccales bacterium]
MEKFFNDVIFTIGTCVEGRHNLFVTYFYQIFTAICPLAVVALYLSMTPDYTEKERLKTAKNGCLIAWFAMILTVVGGPKALSIIGIAMDAFNIAGGLLLVFMGFNMLRSPDPEIAVSRNEAAEIAQLPKKKRQDIAITPFGIPLITGPGVLAIILANRGACQRTTDFIYCLLAISLVVFLMYLILVVTLQGAKWLTPTVLKLSFRLSGLFLVVIGIQFIMNGIKESGLLSNLTNQYIIT